MTSLTLKRIPDEVLARLKKLAGQNGRSLNSEAILRLAESIRPTAVDPEDLLERARQIRSQFRGKIDENQLRELKDRGRS